MKKAHVLVGGAVLLAGLGLIVGKVSSQDHGDKRDMANMPPELKAIADDLAGHFGAKSTFTLPGQPPMESTGEEVCQPFLEGHFLIMQYESKMGPETFQGFGVIGYDTARKKYTIAWGDTEGTGMEFYYGTPDASGKVVTFTGEHPDQKNPSATVKTRWVVTIDSHDRNHFEIYETGADAKEAKVLEIQYARYDSAGGPVDKHHNEASAIAALRTINTQEVLFRDGGKRGDGNNEFGMLSELSNTGLIDAVLGSGTRNGYYFQAAYSMTTSEYLWFGTANPIEPGVTGDRYFEVNADGVIWYTTGERLPMDTDTCVIPNAKYPVNVVGK